MGRRRGALALAAAATVAAVLLPAGPARAPHRPGDIDKMNEYTLARINAGRDHPNSGQNPNGETFGLSWHGCLKVEEPQACPTEGEGLWRVATAHSEAMALAGALEPVVTSGEVAGADPDPPELNGKPDDGFGPPPFVYCANVARTSFIRIGVFPERDIVDRTYEAWRDEQPVVDPNFSVEFLPDTGTRECMFDENHRRYTVAGAGWVREDHPDGLRYRMWVTLIVAVDATPPDFHVLYPCEPPYCPGPTPTPTPSPSPSPTPTPTPLVTPTPTPAPTPTPRPTPTPAPTATPSPPCSPPEEQAVQVGTIYLWTDGVWQETNGYPGLQRREWVCADGTVVPRDTRIIGV